MTTITSTLKDPDALQKRLDGIDRYAKVIVFGLLFFSVCGLAKRFHPKCDAFTLKGVKFGRIARLGLLGTYTASDLGRLGHQGTEKELFGNKAGTAKSVENVSWLVNDACCLLMFVDALFPVDLGWFGQTLEKVCDVSYVAAASIHAGRALTGDEKNQGEAWIDFALMVTSTFAPGTICEALTGLGSGLQIFSVR